MDMENLGKKIVRKCAGLPLAIIVLGGLLATKHSFSEWKEVHANVDLYLRRRGKGADQEYSAVNGVLALSYNELPYHLKSCFLHLGHFPEDYEIPCKTLFRMWVAEGFGSQCQHVGEENETMEDVVERYLYDLIDRSIVQVSRMGSTGRVKTCHLHDLMRDFCLLKANEENYLAIVRTTNLDEKPNINKVHRLGLHGNSLDIGCYGSYLRSLLVLGHRTETITIKSTFIKDIRLLKILHLERCEIPSKRIKDIDGLVHLRYLCIGDHCITEALPSSIGNLRYLQTLIVGPGELYPTEYTIVPNVVWKLEELRHLIIGRWCKIKGDEGLKLGNTRKMQTLWLGYKIVLDDVGELDVNSSQLKKLVIQLNENLGEIPSGCLRSLKSLTITACDKEGIYFQVLKILLSSCPHLMKLFFFGRIKLPAWQHFPPSLTKLILYNTGIKEDPMPILEKLPNLCILFLEWRSFKGRSLVCSSGGFPKLQTLKLYGLKILEEWRVDEEAMPNLSQLHINWCLRLKMIPEGIKFITTLRQLKITMMYQKFVDRVRVVDGREGGDFFKVRHVPFIIIKNTFPQ